MSEYTQALAELAALPRRLEEQVARSKREVAAERERRERQIEAVAREHGEVVARLEAVLEQARSEGVDFKLGRDGGEERNGASADPVAYAQQLVGRLEEALRRFRYTRDVLAAEEAKLSEEERKRLAEERRRREREELRRAEQWEKARQGTLGLLVALAIAAAAGLVGGLLDSPAALALPVLAGVVGFALAIGVTSTLPALATRRASGSEPPLPVAPQREARLGAGGYAAASLACCALGMAIVALVSGGSSATAWGALGITIFGLAAIVFFWSALPRAK